jgi:hypothetical protein
MKSCSLFVVVIVVALASSVSAADEQEKICNPFTVTMKVWDVPNPDGEDVKVFAARTELWFAKDANAAQWVEKATAGKKDSLDGEWSFRWNGSWKGKKWTKVGTATIKKIGDRVYILIPAKTAGEPNILIDAKLHGKSQLVGRWVYIEDTGETTPWVGTIVDNERIDGVWTEGRWDFRRKIADK